MSSFNRVFLLVMDSVGIGAAPDAERFSDAGSATLQHILEQAKPRLVELTRLGLGNILAEPDLLPPVAQPAAHFGKLQPAGAAKDTTTGHWELMGIIRETAPKTYPNGFPAELIDEFSRRIGRGVLGNQPASGTEIIAELGAEHLKTGKVIIYTSADSVFQVAAHEGIVSPEELNRVCRIARELTHGEFEVDRVIARPFTGTPEQGFKRTEGRRDFGLPPPYNCLDALTDAGIPVTLVGKLEDIFAGRGFSRSLHTTNSRATGDALHELKRSGESGLVFANFIDFDMLYGHRNDMKGYAAELEWFDGWLAGFVADWSALDLVIITADHGNDPTTSSTDHSREYVPLLVFPRAASESAGCDLGTRSSFADVGATVLQSFGVTPDKRLAGESFYANIGR
jgi:phosphopentomutase